MYYHASPLGGLRILKPHVSNHGVPLVYFSNKRENVLVYLSNAVERFCRETGFVHDGSWYKWASYGFQKDGRQCIEEYYPDALRKTYEGVSGYIYRAETVPQAEMQLRIPNAVASSEAVQVVDCEFVRDAYAEILTAEAQGLLTVQRFAQMTQPQRRWLERTLQTEYKNAENHPDYRYFLQKKFGI